jgi:ABC-type multidrug transport system ATPase subunit
LTEVEETMATAHEILIAAGLSKTYGTAYRLGPLDLTLAAGDTVALLGPNGAGKTTLFQLLTGMSDPSAGEIRLEGKKLTPDTPAIKRRLGYLPQNHYLPRWVSGREILDYGASLYGLPDAQARVDAAVAYWDCAAYAHKPLAACSHGMKKRLALALATLHEPVCLFLDEPYSGLDLYHIHSLDKVIAARRRDGQATILSTHVAPYAARHCNRALVLKAGSLQILSGWEAADFTARVQAIEAAFFGNDGGDGAPATGRGRPQ